MATTSDKLDLSECELSAIPAGVFDLRNLRDLSLAGNSLTSLPPEIGNLTCLERLVLAGNDLEALPGELTLLSSLRGFWAHGNRLTALPEDWAALGSLETLSLAGNAIERVPDSVGALTALTELNLAGNRLASLPDSVAGLQQLRKLHLHGNRLAALPAALGALPHLQVKTGQGLRFRVEGWSGRLHACSCECAASRTSGVRHLHFRALCSLPLGPPLRSLTSIAPIPSNPSPPTPQELKAMGNRLASVPPGLLASTSLAALNLADNALASLPPDWSAMGALQAVWLYGNALPRIPPSIAALPALKSAWLEGNPCGGAATAEFLAAADGNAALERVGLDASQVPAGWAETREGVAAVRLDACAAAAVVRLSVAAGEGGRGYFKLQPGEGHGEEGRCLVVAFGSAPGDPNWGGLLSRVRAACKDSAHR